MISPILQWLNESLETVLPWIALSIESIYLEFDALVGKAWGWGFLAVALQV